MTGGMSSRSCYTKLNFDYPYTGSLSLILDPYICPTYRHIKHSRGFLHTSLLLLIPHLSSWTLCFGTSSSAGYIPSRTWSRVVLDTIFTEGGRAGVTSFTIKLTKSTTSFQTEEKHSRKCETYDNMII